MALTKDKKKQIYDRLADVFKKNPGAVFVHFHKLNVADTTTMRRALRAGGVGYVVAKKTLIKKALADQKLAGELPALDGEVAVAYSADLLAPAREIYPFQKKFDGAVSILGGIFEGAFKNKEEMVAYASIPSRQVLLAQFANVINSPIQGLAIALSKIAEGKGAAAGAAAPAPAEAAPAAPAAAQA